jgi:hypothetical protein
MDNLRALETLLAQKRRLGGELLSFDGYDRWGAQHDTPEHRAEMEADAARIGREYAAVVERLGALVARLRTEDPTAIERWADLHCELLRAFVTTCARAEATSHESTGAMVASDEIEGWAAVKRGDKPFVEENVYYVSVDRARYVAAFGIEP